MPGNMGAPMPNTMGFGSNGAMQPYGSHGLGGLQVAGLRLPTSPPPLAPPFPEPPTATTPYPYNQPLMPIHGDTTSWPKVPVNTYGSAPDTRYVGQQPSMATQFTLPPTMQVLPGYSPQLQIDTTRKRLKPASVIRAFAVAQQLLAKLPDHILRLGSTKLPRIERTFQYLYTTKTYSKGALMKWMTKLLGPFMLNWKSMKTM